MRILGRTVQTVIWLIFAVLVVFFSTVYFLDQVISYSAVSVYSIVLWGAVLFNTFLLLLVAHLALGRNPGFLRLGGFSAAAVELACFLVLLGAGLYFRLGETFASLWRESGSVLVQAAMAGEDAALSGAGAESVASGGILFSAYVSLLRQGYLLFGNRELVAPGMQLILFFVTAVLLYFLIRRSWGSITAVFVWGCLMLLPGMLRFSVESDPFVLLLLSAVLAGWILHGFLGWLIARIRGRRLSRGQEAWMDLVPVGLCAAWSVYVSLRQGWTFPDGLPVTDVSALAGTGLWRNSVTVSGQEILLFGLAALLMFLFLEERREVSAYAVMAAVLLLLQLLGLDGGGGCGVLLYAVLSLLAGTGVEALIFSGGAQIAAEETGERRTAGTREKTGRRKKTERMVSHAPEPEKSSEPAAAPETAPRPEIYLPKSMEIPRRKTRARLEFDRDFDESELKYDIEVLEDEDYDLRD